MRIGLTFNLKPPGATGDEYEEYDSEETIAALEAAIASSGHQTVRLGWGDEMLDGLRGVRVGGVFNIAEGRGGRGRESQVPAVLEMLGIPCSGAPPLSIAMTLDKALAKRVAQAHGIPTSKFEVVELGRPRPQISMSFPLFAKPAAEGSSMGITASSLCRDEQDLDAAIGRLSKYGPVLVEEFLPGEEYTVGIIAGAVLGVMKVVPRKNEPDFIYSLDVKRDYLNQVEYQLADAADVEKVAIDVWHAFGLRDVARVDIRRDSEGVPNFIEVNPLPGVHPINSDLIILGRLLGIGYEDLIGRVISSAVARWM
jgi:D-alanine-D-alanine ligase